MRIALISDIHGNSEALAAVFDDIASAGADEIFCLGDLVGYGPEPDQVVARVKDRARIILAGNHDFAAVGRTDIDGFNVYARQAIIWTMDRLTEDSMELLRGLEYVHHAENALFVHATPELPEEWHYITSYSDAENNFRAFDDHICFIGHSHTPIIFERDSRGEVSVIEETYVRFDAACRYIVNIGSVGQPRDLDPRSSYGIYDSEESSFELRRADYDIGITRSKIIDAGLPRFLADRLIRGQ